MKEKQTHLKVKGFFGWEVHLAYPVSLQALYVNNSETNDANRT